MEGPNPRRLFSNIAGAPVLDLPSRGVIVGEALVSSIGRSEILFVSAIIRVRRDACRDEGTAHVSWRQA